LISEAGPIGFIVKFNLESSLNQAPMPQKIILITGVTGSLGKPTAIEIAKTGAHLVLLARNKEKLEAVKKEVIEQSKNSNIEILVADLTDIASIKSAVSEFKNKHNRLDVLVNIAAVYRKNRELTKSGLEMMFASNHLSVFTLTNELLDLLKASSPSRIITVSAPSTTKLNFDDLQGEQKFSALGSFGASKMMNLMFTYDLARRLEGTGVSAMALHPGLVKSDLTKEMPGALRLLFKMISSKPDKPAKMLAKLATDAQYQDANGKFFKFNGSELKSAPHSYDKAQQEKLWSMTQDLVS
jgi:NAD(P)-dependent dehydrogenase (short-subunit alcohol dehydrogenase family)